MYPTFEEEKNVGRISDNTPNAVVLILKDEVKEREEEFSSNRVIMFPNGGGKQPPTTCEDIDEFVYKSEKEESMLAWLQRPEIKK